MLLLLVAQSVTKANHMISGTELILGQKVYSSESRGCELTGLKSCDRHNEVSTSLLTLYL